MIVKVQLNGKKVHEEQVAGPKEAIQLRRVLLEKYPGGVVEVIDNAPTTVAKKRAPSSKPAVKKTTSMSLNALQELHPERHVKPTAGGAESPLKHKQVKVLPKGKRTPRLKKAEDE